MNTRGRRGLSLIAALWCLALYGCAGFFNPQTPDASAPDAAISAKVRSALAADPRVQARLIQVGTVDGVVRLSGFADSRPEAEHAISIANGVPGVKRVQDEIVVRTGRDRKP